MSSAPFAVVREAEDVGLLSNNHRLVETLRSALGSGDHAYATVPSLIEEVIEDGAWLARMDSNGRRYGAKDFPDFIRLPAPNGMGLSFDDVRRYLGDSSNPHRIMFEEAVTKGPGNPCHAEQPKGEDGRFRIHPIVMNTDNAATTVAAPRHRESQGNTVGYAVRRLERERPDLLARVETGEMSAHAASVAAGFREKSITIPADPEGAVRRLVRHFRGEHLAALIDGLTNWARQDTEAG